MRNKQEGREIRGADRRALPALEKPDLVWMGDVIKEVGCAPFF